MIAPSRKTIPNGESCALVIFDVRIPGASQRFSRKRAAWQECADVEMLDLNHPVLIVQVGRARRLEA